MRSSTSPAGARRILCGLVVAGFAPFAHAAPPIRPHISAYLARPATPRDAKQHVETPDQPRRASPAPTHLTVPRTTPRAIVTRGPFQSVQVNTDGDGNNIVGDAANEPGIAVDPTDPARIAIGWRQFDTITSNFRQAGNAFTLDAGRTWSPAPVIQPGVFRSDPVLDYDRNGNIFYYSLSSLGGVFFCDMFKSAPGDTCWSAPVYGFGGDKQWFTVDRTNGIGSGHIYAEWTVFFSCCPEGHFTRSTDGGASFETPIDVPLFPFWGTLTVGPDGELYVAGREAINGTMFACVRSTNAENSAVTPTFDVATIVDLGGGPVGNVGPNPGGLLGQTWIATDHTNGPNRGNVYMLCSVDPPGPDPLDVMFVRSIDGGLTFSTPVRVNDDPAAATNWNWFGTMSVAPNGRIDVVWNDTRNDPTVNTSELRYTSSSDGGQTWAASVPLSPPFNHFVGYPQQNKIGDYYDMESDNLGAHLAWAATFNGEQDVYYLRIGPADCNGNGIADADDILGGTSADTNADDVPDECEDCNGNTIPDGLDIAGGTSLDCNANRVPDECDCVIDCNGNAIADDCDIAAGTSGDCNANRVPDDCDIAAGTSFDTNNSAVPDECETQISFVDRDATGLNNGANWTDAYADLQTGLTAAANSVFGRVEIWVAAGTYRPDGGTLNRSLAFQLVNNTEVYGGFNGTETMRNQRDPAVNVTTLSGDLAGNDAPNFANNADNSIHVVTSDGTDASAVLDGFTISGGNANGADPVTRRGAGLYNGTGAPAIVNCIFTSNSANDSGGAAYNGGAAQYRDCSFIRNRATNNAGALAVDSANPVMTRCLFSANTSASGGAIRTTSGAMALDRCTFVGNAATANAGAILISSAAPTITGCVFSGNTAGGNGGAASALSSSNPRFSQSTFSRNAAGNTGGGIINNTSSNSDFRGCILWGNSDSGGSGESAQIRLVTGTVAVNYCDVQGLTGSLGGTGNLGLDPLFIDSDGPDNTPGTPDDNLRLQAASPCIDTGDPAAAPPPNAVDIDGQPRIMACAIDIGADERLAGAPNSGDLGADGSVDPTDVPLFVNVLLFGGTPADICVADMNFDATVGGSDIQPFVTALLP
ncbi:MAG: hypothetical protein L6Q92_08690 [Phycisphaerae bacterium]|nr:hypothetical protein [Phycisphaerae bacterium]